MSSPPTATAPQASADDHPGGLPPARSSAGGRVWAAFLSTRPWSFTMTFSSVTLGALLAALVGRFDVGFYLMTLLGMISFHAATNVLNDYYDVRHGVDSEGTATTRYRLHPGAKGITTLSFILRFSVLLYGATFVFALWLAYVTGPWILAIVGAGVLGSVLYTADPVVLKARALGEVTVFVMWGLLIPLGAYMVQTGVFSWVPTLAALPVGLLVALVLLANNTRDINFDGSVNTRTVAVLLGERSAARLYGVLLAATFLFVPLAIVAGLVSLWSLAVFLTLPEALGLWRMMKGPIPDNADPRTAALTLHFALVYMASFVLAILVPLGIP